MRPEKGMKVVEQAYADMHIRGTGELWLPAPLAAPHEGPAAPARRGSLLSLLSMPFWNTGAKIKTNFLHWWTIVWDNDPRRLRAFFVVAPNNSPLTWSFRAGLRSESGSLVELQSATS